MMKNEEIPSFEISKPMHHSPLKDTHTFTGINLQFVPMIELHIQYHVQVQ